MSNALSARRLKPEDWRGYRDLRLRALAESPDAFGSTFAHEAKRSDAEWAARLERGADDRFQLPVVAELGGEPIGLAWGWINSIDPQVAYVFQMWVAPEHRGLGGGWLLLEEVIDWARQAGARFLLLDVTCGNETAARLYTLAGFTPVGEPQPLRPESNLLKQRMRLVLQPGG